MNARSMLKTNARSIVRELVEIVELEVEGVYDSKEREAYYHGKQSGAVGHPHTHNPHERGSKLHRYWRNGWRAATGLGKDNPPPRNRSRGLGKHKPVVYPSRIDM
jgi:ribosome modulation factor